MVNRRAVDIRAVVEQRHVHGAPAAIHSHGAAERWLGQRSVGGHPFAQRQHMFKARLDRAAVVAVAVHTT
jgi:hypothetical protein